MSDQPGGFPREQTLGDIESVNHSRVLITGGLGFLGAWLARRLAREGNEITLIDVSAYDGSTASALGLRDLDSVRILRGDVCDRSVLRQLGNSFDYIIHAAGILGAERVVREPLRTLDVNIGGAQSCLEFASSQHGIRRVILLSTSEIYGRDASGAHEDDPARILGDSVRWGYAASKLATEFLARAFLQERGLPVVIIRPFNVYGPYRRSENAMTTLIDRALRDRELVIQGDGSQRRSWCFVTDFADGLERCLTSPYSVGEVFNLGDDRAELSMLDLVSRIIRETGSQSAVSLLRTDVPDVQCRRPILTKARAMLGYEPRVRLDQGIRRIIRSATGTLRRRDSRTRFSTWIPANWAAQGVVESTSIDSNQIAQSSLTAAAPRAES